MQDKYRTEVFKNFTLDSPFKNNSLGNIMSGKEERYIVTTLKESTMKSLSSIKENIIDSKRKKMRVVNHYLCDSCDKNIQKPTDGFVIHGNIYLADPDVRGGLIGDNFPKPDEKNNINADSIKQTVLCKDCFLRALGFSSYANSKYGSIKKDYW